MSKQEHEIEYTNGASKLRLLVESKSRPVSITKYSSRPIFASGFSGSSVAKRALISEKALDDFQKGIVQRARTIANELGMSLEIIDVARESAPRRLWRRLTGKAQAPSLIMPESMWESIDLASVLDEIKKRNPLNLKESIDLLHKHMRPQTKNFARKESLVREDMLVTT